jgi:hypothetical protein
VNSYKRPRAGLRGAGLRRVVAAQPLGADPDPALQAGSEQATRAEIRCPDPGLQPVPDLRALLHAGSRGSRRATSSRRRWRRTSTT